MARLTFFAPVRRAACAAAVALAVAGAADVAGASARSDYERLLARVEAMRLDGPRPTPRPQMRRVAADAESARPPPRRQRLRRQRAVAGGDGRARLLPRLPAAGRSHARRAAARHAGPPLSRPARWWPTRARCCAGTPGAGPAKAAAAQARRGRAHSPTGVEPPHSAHRRPRARVDAGRRPRPSRQPMTPPPSPVRRPRRAGARRPSRDAARRGRPNRPAGSRRCAACGARRSATRSG